MNNSIKDIIKKYNGERTFFDNELLGVFFTTANLEKLIDELSWDKRLDNAVAQRDFAEDALSKNEQKNSEMLGLLKEARKIIRASSSRNLAKDWDNRTTEILKGK